MTTTWKFGGTNLSTFGPIGEVAGAYQTPKKRNENIIVPFRHGRRVVTKFYDQRVISVKLTITAATPTVLEATLKSMNGLLATAGQQQLEQTMEDGSVRTALAEVVEETQVKRQAGNVAKVVIPFELSNPLFRSTTLWSLNSAIGSSPTSMSIVNNGTVETRQALLSLIGPLSHPKLLIGATGAYVQYDDVVANGHTVVLDCDAMTAVLDGSTDVIGKVIYIGDVCFLTFPGGPSGVTTALSVYDNSPSTGHVQVSFYPLYL